jgi:hypothetical protein
MLATSHALAQGLVVKSIVPITLANTEAEELMPLFDSYNQVLYFTRVGYQTNVGGVGSGSDVWALPLKDKRVAKSINDLSWNNRENNALVGLNANGSTVYLLNGYGKQNGIAFSRNLSGTWTKPEVIPVPGLSPYGFKGFYMSPDFKYLLISMSSDGSYGEEDLYVSVKQPNGKWAKPKNLGATINTTGFEISPFLSLDGKTLFFASNGHGGLGSSDIFKTQRLYDSWDVWTKPENLGETINSAGFDAFFSFYDSVAFLSSNRQGKRSDLYRLTLEGRISTTNTVAVSDQILSDPEIVALFGFIFDPLIEFEKGTSGLTARDRELLWFVADKLSKRPDVRIGLYQPGANNRKKNQLIIDYLNELNFSTERVVTDLGEWKPTASKLLREENVQLIFFKQ